MPKRNPCNLLWPGAKLPQHLHESPERPRQAPCSVHSSLCVDQKMLNLVVIPESSSSANSEHDHAQCTHDVHSGSPSRTLHQPGLVSRCLRPQDHMLRIGLHLGKIIRRDGSLRLVAHLPEFLHSSIRLLFELLPLQSRWRARSRPGRASGIQLRKQSQHRPSCRQQSNKGSGSDNLPGSVGDFRSTPFHSSSQRHRGRPQGADT
mmetsp:Transcript_4547/g.10693  ORF Transcript_4547/g.10693 Transcript_4547/m.10693 type:complete len:205 (+) Transcript_4547:1846-2460(+)